MLFVQQIKLFIFLILLFHLDLYGQERKSINWKRDIAFLKTELPAKHKNLFFKINSETYRLELDHISENSSKEFSDLAIVLQLQELIAAMGDSHTGMNIYPMLNKGHRFPFKIYWFADGPYIISASDHYRNIIGKKIIAVNNTQWDSVVHRLSSLITIDNVSILHKEIPDLLAYGDLLEYKKMGQADSIVLKIADKNGKQENVFILSHNRLPFNKEDFINVGTGKHAIYLKNAGQPFWLDYNANDSILFFGYNKCWSRELEEEYGDKVKALSLPSFTVYTDSVLNMIRSGIVAKLIVDFRLNSGGSSLQGSDFAGKIAQEEMINQSGKLFVVVGRKTFSSAVLNVMDFKKVTKAVLIGEPTGGKPNHYGEIKRFKLPSSGISISCSTKYFYRDEANSDAIYPDVDASVTFDFYILGIDPVYETIRNWKNDR